ncbi:MAG: hypothetical protein SGPRY_003945 [Prymnesium sp.]
MHASAPLPSFTSSLGEVRWDATALRLKGVSWFGFEGVEGVVDGLWQQPMRAYLAILKKASVNALRIPLAVDLIERNPGVRAEMIKGEPALPSSHTRYFDALDRLVALAAAEEMLVLFDVHRLRASVWPDPRGLLVVFVEGVGNEEGEREYFWGENLEEVGDEPVELRVAEKVVYSPHVYGPGKGHEMPYFASSSKASLSSIWER